jgi:hypothetical protein
MKFTGRIAKRHAPYPRTAYTSKLGRPSVVVFGVNKNGAVRGACFSGEKIWLAGLAAVLLKFDVFEALSNEMRELAKELPSGHVYADGRAFLPIITKGLYKRLYVASGGLVRDGSLGP